MVKATEGILGLEWSEMILRHGDWGRDGLLAVATRHLGWRLGEVVEREPGVSYAAAAQGIRRFWKRVPNSPEMQAFVAALLDQLSNVGSAAKSPVFGIEPTVPRNGQIGNDTFSPIGRLDFRGG